MKISSKRKISTKIHHFLSLLTVFGLIFNIFFTNFTFLEDVAIASAAENMCQVPVDVTIILDTSGSMGEGGTDTACNWKQLELIGSSYQWVNYSESNITEGACATKCGDLGEYCQTPVFTPATPSKMESAKSAANDFIDDLGANDQSALVSFNNTAVLVKQLSSDHASTKSAVDGLTYSGATNIGDAIEFSSVELSSVRANPQAVKTMILLTDGRANRPNGNGTGENSTDVTYAETKASEAAALGYKIFTIGLGTDSELNETMLQNIASTSGAQYYHADNGDNLSTIYSQISLEVCQYASISGCKYSDDNNNGLIEEDETKLSGWEIVLAGDASATQSTDENGCYSFAGLLAGNYTVSEGANAEKQPYTQVWPVGNLYEVNLAKGQDASSYDFANYVPTCGNNILDGDTGEACDDGNTNSGDNCSSTCQIEESVTINNNIISGYKYNDLDGLASTTDDLLGLGDWTINLFLSSNTSTPLLSTTTDSLGYFEFSSLTADDYLLTENLVSGWTQLLAPSAINLVGTSTVSSDNNFVNYYSGEVVVYQCENGIDDDDDSLVDTLDPGCYSDGNVNNSESYDPSDNNETDQPVLAGDIVINEIMQNPAIVSDTRGEWFELYNPTNNYINLKGCSIADSLVNLHTISSDLIIPSQDYVVLGRNSNSALNGGYTPDYVFNNFTLGNDNDEIILSCNDVEIDRVEYDNGATFPDPTGSSMILASPTLDNNNGYNWCASTSLFGLGDKGTPGTLNDLCAEVIVCGNGEIEEGETCDDGNTDSGDNCSSTCQIEESSNNNIISGYKYNDLDGLASTTDDLLGLGDWTINLFLSSNTSTPLLSTTTDSLGYFEFSSLTADDYLLTENLVSGWTQLLAPSAINLIGTSTVSTDNNFVNYFNSEDSSTVCGNGEVESEEVCDDGELNGTVNYCNSTCDGQTPTVVITSGGGGGGSISELIIFNEQDLNEDTSTVDITWQTNHFSSSRVIYSSEDEPHEFNYSNPPNYGYAHSTIDDLNPVTFHQVSLTGLIPGTTYYYRVISHASPDTVGASYTFTTAGTKPVALVNSTESGSGPSSAPNPEQGFIAGLQGTGENVSVDNENNNPEENQPEIRVEGAQETSGEVAGEQETCVSWPWWLIIIMLIDYLILMVLNYLDKFKKELTDLKKGLGKLFALLLIVLPILVYWFSASFAWWAWLLVVIAYIIVLLAWITDLHSKNYWRLSVIITLYLALMLALLKMFIC